VAARLACFAQKRAIKLVEGKRCPALRGIWRNGAVVHRVLVSGHKGM